ncbi:MAG: sodium:solute symporter family protein [Gammaproteobacteria bacterium]|nr:sodium:solute symporter family protein [Gammaproteobacteria bacterium]
MPWTFVGHPGKVYADGFQYAYASFYAITIPFTGMLFLKRQWMLGNHYGFVTPGEMFSTYFKSNGVRFLVVLVALVFSVPYLGLQLRASGFLFNVLTDGQLGVNVGMYLLSAVVVIYVVLGGLRAVAEVDTMQLILLSMGIMIISLFVLDAAGGWEQLRTGIAALTEYDSKRTPEPDLYSHYVAIPGVIQMVDAGSKAEGGAWTGIMILTYMFALMGIQASPAFSMWAFSNENPKPFAPQQVWASSLIVGFTLIVFTAIQGIGGHMVGADAGFMQNHPEIVKNILGGYLNNKDLMEHPAKQGALVPALIRAMADSVPWLAALLAICALAAMQSTGAAYMSTAGSILVRDFLMRFKIELSDEQQKFWGRIMVLGVVVAALGVATFSTDALVLLGGLAVAYGLQMWPALIGICWWPFLTRQGVTIGLIAGLIAVTMTDKLGIGLFNWLGIQLPWGRFPLTIHSAGWGIFFNLSLAIIISCMTRDKKEKAHRMTFHNYLRKHASLSAAKKKLVPLAWLITLGWFFFAVGPGALIGNDLFGNPNDSATWTFGMPSIWIWQILWWGLGVGMMWFLAYKMEMSTYDDRRYE